MEYVRRYILNEYNAMGVSRREIPTNSYFYKILEIETPASFYKNYFEHYGQKHWKMKIEREKMRDLKNICKTVWVFLCLYFFKQFIYIKDNFVRYTKDHRYFVNIKNLTE